MAINIVPFDFEGSEVRFVGTPDNPWWVASDVCQVLGVQNVTQSVDRLDDDERSMFNIGRQGEAWCINESGLYSMILRSRKPQARRFRKWVTSEVIPSIRKTGKYETPKDQKIFDAEKHLNLLERAKNFLQELGQLNELDQLKLADQARNVLDLSMPRTISAINEEGSPELKTVNPGEHITVSIRASELGFQLTKSQEVSIGLRLSNAYLKRYGYRPMKHKQEVGGKAVNVCNYTMKDIDLMDGCILSVMQTA